MAEWQETFWPGIASAPRIRDTRSGHYNRYVPDPLMKRPLDLDGDVAAMAAQVESMVRKIEDQPGARGMEALSRFLLRSEAIASSRIEGLSASPQQVGLAELAQNKEIPKGRYNSTAHQVAALITTVRNATHAIAEEASVSPASILDLQRRLVGEDSPLAGLRTEQNWVGGSDYHPLAAEFVPPPPELVPPLMQDLTEYMDRGDHAPLIQAALVHAQFETLHPFRDGNGRVGRALIHTVLVRRHLTRTAVLPISPVLLTRSDEYVAGLTAYRYAGVIGSEACNQAVSSWVRTFLQAAKTAVELAELFAAELEELRNEWEGAVARLRTERGVRVTPRSDSATARILASLQENPVLTPTMASRQLEISPHSARNALEELADASVLKRGSVNDKATCYSAVAVFDMLTLGERRLASTKWDTRDSRPNRPTPALPQPQPRPLR